MTTYFLYAKENKKIEVLDTISLEIGTQILLPQWDATPMLVSDIIFTGDMQGNNCSLSQMIYVEKQEK